MRELRSCPGCGFAKFGACSVCFPLEAERELQQEIAGWQAEAEDRARRDAGMIYCQDHERHDGCYRIRTPAEIRAELRNDVVPRAPDWRTATTWQECMAILRRRYAPPG